MVKKKDLNSKDSIIKAAFSLFLQKGFKEVTIKNIMEITKLSKGAIYHHFESKEDIYSATIETYYFELMQPERLNFKSGNFVQDIKYLRDFALKLFDSIENISLKDSDYPIRNYFSFQLESEKNEAIHGQTTLTVSKFRNLIRDIIHVAHDNQQLKSNLDLEAITFTVIGLIEGVALHHSTIKDNVKKELSKKYNLVFDSYLKFICADYLELNSAYKKRQLELTKVID